MNRFANDNRSAGERNYVLCRQFLMEREGKDVCTSDPRRRRPLPDLTFVRIKGLTGFWEEQAAQSYLRLFEQIPGTLIAQNSVFAFLVRGDAKGVSFYMGVNRADAGTLTGALTGFLPGVVLGDCQSIAEIDPPCNFGGVMVGNPNEPEAAATEAAMPLPVDSICRGMAGSEFCVLVLASRLPNSFIYKARQTTMDLMRALSRYQRSGVESVEQSHITLENYEVQEYMQNLEKMGEMLRQSTSSGLWETSVYYAANVPEQALRLQGILKGSFNGQCETVCQPVSCLNMRDIRSYISPVCALMEDLAPDRWESPVSFMVDGDGSFAMNDQLYRTTLSGRQMSMLCRLPQHEYPGYFIDTYVEFDTCQRNERGDKTWVRIGAVTQPGRGKDGFDDIPYELELNDFTRHLLVVGITGGGKSNTSKSLLRTLWGQYHKPFLVIESAKREYHELMKLDAEGEDGPFSQLCVFTMGDDNVLPYRINPFERIEGVGLQTHIDYLLSSFNAAFEMAPPMPYVLESSVYEVYEDRGWDVTSGKNKYGRQDYPTLTDLYYKIDVVTNRLGYHAEVQNNVKAALKARINSLRIGGKGLMMDTPHSVPIGSLLDKPVVLELEDLADDDIKAFVIGVLLVQLYEYRKGQSLLASERASGGDVPASSKAFQHLLVVEEAHRLLKKVSPGDGNPSRAKSVEFFCNMLAEIRSYGQALMICDQVPTKLAPDVLKNTNLKLIHRTVMEEDRQAVGAAMNMKPQQVEYLSSLRRGCAATFAEGDNRPKLIMLPLVKDKRKMGRAQILERCRKNIGENFSQIYVSHTKYDLCRFCQEQCDSSVCRQMQQLLVQYPVKDAYIMPRVTQAQQNRQPMAVAFNCTFLLRLIKTLEMKAGALSAQQRYCLAAQLIAQMPLQPEEKYALAVEYQKEWSRLSLTAVPVSGS